LLADRNLHFRGTHFVRGAGDLHVTSFVMDRTGRAEIAAAQRAGWAKAKGKNSAPKPAKKKDKRSSPAVRAKIADAILKDKDAYKSSLPISFCANDIRASSL
jgi:hypothetical protein